MKKLLTLTLALMMLLSAAAVVHAENVEITYMASQDWVQDAEMELALKFTEKTGIKVDFQIIPSTWALKTFIIPIHCDGSTAFSFSVTPACFAIAGIIVSSKR